MKRLMIASLLATAAVAAPASARDGSWYAGIEGGFLWAKDQSVRVVDSDPLYEARIDVDNGSGYDIDGIVGYDFGMFRVEGELAFKRAKHREYDIDYLYDGTVYDSYNYDADGHTSVTSGMINLLADFGNEDGFSFYVGPGLGISGTKINYEDEIGDETSVSDSGFAWQLIAGARYAISPTVDLGLKYRYFVGNKIKDDFNDFGYSGDVRASRFKSSSLLASLIFNFAPPPPPVVAPAPVVEAPVVPAPEPTQTCYDGSVIPASAVCPQPPAPTPAPAGERG